VVAEAISDLPRDKLQIMTKCGDVWEGDKGQMTHTCNYEGKLLKIYRYAGKESILRECEDSLRRLKVDAIDLYQIHWPADDSAESQEGWETLAALQKEGKCRWIGASNFSKEELRSAQLIAPITSLQPPYSLVKRDVEADILPFCKEQGIGVIVYSPMGSGLLTGAMTAERAAHLPKDDWRSKNPEFQEPKLSKNLQLAERVKTVAQRHGVSPGAVAAAWTMNNPAVTGAIIGARNARQVEEIFPHADLTLSPEEIVELEA